MSDILDMAMECRIMGYSWAATLRTIIADKVIRFLDWLVNC
jgi:hypothetical protein